MQETTPNSAKENLDHVSQNPGKTLSTNTSERNNILNTVKTWDELSYKAILSELAPKGFKESRDKRFRGTIISTLDMLTKKRVDKTCRIAASLVRGYRENLRKVLQGRLSKADEAIKMYTELHEELPFYKLRMKQTYRLDIQKWQAARCEILQQINELDNVSIKS